MLGKGAEYLGSQEVARLLHVSPKTVARWADNGWLPCQVTLGGHRRFRRDHVEALVERMEGEDAGPERRSGTNGDH